MAILKNSVRQLARRFGYQIVKWKPFATLGSIQLALAYYLNVRPEAVFVQIGACDGTTGDPVHDFIKQGALRSVLLEPIAHNFRGLEEVYAGVPNVTLLQAAIGNTDGNVSIYSVKSEGRWKGNKWGKQWASFDKWRILKHGVKESEIQEDVVPSVTLPSIIERFSLPRIDVLQIDTEGFDRHVVDMALKLPSPPECIGFEFIHMTHRELSELMERLQVRGYLWNFDDQNAVAVHRDLFRRWTERAPVSSFANQQI
ncbi:MAG: FkbM family methyltransferase [Pirellulales bacterium]